MAPNTQKLTAVFLYSRKDEAFKEGFSDYLKLLQSGYHLSSLTFQDIDNLSPFRFEQVLEEVDLFLFACSAHLFAHPNMQHGVFRRLVRYHHMGRLRAVAISCRPWKLEETVLKGVIHLPENGRPAGHPSWGSEDEAFLHIFHALRALCEEWLEKKTRLELSWKQAQVSHEVEAYYAFLKQYPHSRYSAEALNLADNLSEQELWMQAKEHKGLVNYFRFMLSSPQQKEHLEEAALNITRIENDEEQVWADTLAQKGPEFFFRYKAMFPTGKYVKEAGKQIREFLKKPIALAVAHRRASESLYLTYQAYKRLPAEEFFSLSFYLSYWSRLNGKAGTLSDNLARKPLRYPFYIALAFLLALTFFSWKVEGDSTGLPSPGWLIAVIVVGFVAHCLVRYRLRKDQEMVSASLLALEQAAAFLKTGFLANDPQMVRETLDRMTQIERLLEDIEHKNFLHYLLPKKQAQPKWMQPGVAA